LAKESHWPDGNKQIIGTVIVREDDQNMPQALTRPLPAGCSAPLRLWLAEPSPESPQAVQSSVQGKTIGRALRTGPYRGGPSGMTSEVSGLHL
jgi:hypothetical protein